jgi:TetR/AcrR family tetracycline transcriptional repressor
VSAPALSRATAVATAVRLLDADGAGALTMRRLAREMGVPLMSLYRHVRSKDDLDAAIVETLLAGLPRPDRRGSWEERIRGWADAYRRMVMAHPHAAPLLASRPAAGYGARAEDAEEMLAELEEAGLAPREARIRMRAAIVSIAGFCNAQAQSGQVVEEGPGAPPAGLPRLAALLDAVRERRHADAVFTAMVDAVVAGIAAALPR